MARKKKDFETLLETATAIVTETINETPDKEYRALTDIKANINNRKIDIIEGELVMLSSFEYFILKDKVGVTNAR